jgi:hypothetical protein
MKVQGDKGNYSSYLENKQEADAQLASERDEGYLQWSADSSKFACKSVHS